MTKGLFSRVQVAEYRSGEITEFAALDSEPSQTNLYMPDKVEEEFSSDDADLWLANLARNDTDDLQYNIVGTAISPPTSLAMDTRTAQGRIYKGCRCPHHQDIYDNWPTQSANLNIVSCMKICLYCGKDSPITRNLRKHLINTECNDKNLKINIGKPGGQRSTSP
jgi:hypothetical protein